MRKLLNERMIPRKEMPQIPHEHYDEMFDYLESEGISFEKFTIEWDELIPNQKLDSDKVGRMISNKKCLDKPILIDKNFNIVDGHHRWGAAKELDRPLKVIQIKAGFERIRDLFDEFSKPEYKGMSESMAKKNKTESDDKIKTSGVKNKINFNGDIDIDDLIFEDFAVDLSTLPSPETEAEANSMSRLWFNRARNESNDQLSKAYLKVSQRYLQAALTLSDPKSSENEAFTTDDETTNKLKQSSFLSLD